MTDLRDDFFLPGPDEPAGVVSWGKSPEQTERDLANAVARLGGIRTVDYGQAYLLAANTLLRTARDLRAFDHHGLPIFYLQRHAAELLIKNPLLLALEIQEYREQVGMLRPLFPTSEAQRERIGGSHDLQRLLLDLEEMARALTVGPVPIVLRQAVSEILAIERHTTWARYSFHSEGGKRQPKRVEHLKQEVALPLGLIQNLLQASNDALGSIWPGDGRMMGSLGELWQDVARAAGVID